MDLYVLAAATAAAAPQDARADVWSSVGAFMDAGGVLMWPLLALALLVPAVALVKIVQFSRLKVGDRAFVPAMLELIRADRPAEAVRQLSGMKQPVARVMEAAVRGKANPRMSDELVREETTRIAQAQLDGLERGLAVLTLVASIAPLVGLLGTVTGLIQAFQQISAAGSRVEPATLAGGIWEALLTTAAGLSIAIPAAIVATYLQRKVDVEAQHMEDAATQVFTAPLWQAVEDASDAQRVAAE